MFGLFLVFYQVILVVDLISCSGERRFIVKIETDKKNSSCVGTVITEKVLLTAAHCVHDAEPSALSVLQFTPEVYKHQVDAVTLHPDFDLPTLYGDIALIKLKSHLRQPWKPIVINDAPLLKSLNVYEDCSMVGWMISSNMSPITGEKQNWTVPLDKSDLFWFEDRAVKLIRVPVSLITGAECSKRIKHFGGYFHGGEKLCGLKVSNKLNHWCSVGSGGPLLCSERSQTWGSRAHRKNPPDIMLEYARINFAGVNDTLEDPLDLLPSFKPDAEERMKRSYDDIDDEYQLAIVSWGKICSNVPSVFIRTDSYYDWIKNSVADFDSASSIRAYSSAFSSTISLSCITIQFHISLSLISTICAYVQTQYRY